VGRSPPSCGARRSKHHMGLYPDSRSAALSRLGGSAAPWHGWCSPEAIDQTAAGDGRYSRIPGGRGHLLRHARDRGRLGTHSIYVCTKHLLFTARRRRRSARGRCARAAGRRSGIQRTLVSSASALATSAADGIGSTECSWGPLTLEDVPQLAKGHARRTTSCCPTSSLPGEACADPLLPGESPRIP